MGFGEQSWLYYVIIWLTCGSLLALKTNQQVQEKLKQVSLKVFVLGSLFFLLYINDLEVGMQKCKITMIADDTSIYPGSSLPS